MAEKDKQNKDFESVNFIVFLWKWRLTLVIVTLVAGIAAAIFSGPTFIEPRFRARVLMFPSSTGSISKALIAEDLSGRRDIMELGEEEQAEQMLQILGSNPVRSRVIHHFELMDHYDIDTNSRFPITQLYKQYEKNIQFKRTEYMAVEITVLDKDPAMAANVANFIADIYDTVKTHMHRQRAYKAYRLVEQEYMKQKHEVQAMEDSLSSLRALGIHDYESQSERLTEELAKQLARGNQPAINRLNERLEILGQYGGAFVSIRDALEYEKKEHSRIKTKYKEAKMDAHAVLPHKFMVQEAYEPEKKAYPIRWLIVVVSALGAFILCLILIIVFQNISNLRKIQQQSA